MSENPVNSKGAATSLPRDAVVNWDKIIHKNVRTLDNQGMGKIIAAPSDEGTITISSQSGGEQYKVPKSSVSGFNGAEVLLNETAYKVSSSYRVKDAGVYEAKPSNIITKEHSHKQEEETTVPLIEEQLNVSKKVITDEVTIIREPVTETKTIGVSVMHEELVLERRPPTSAEEDNNTTVSVKPPPKNTRTQIRIPLIHEEIRIKKEPYVKEEIVISKKPRTETKTVTDFVISEKVDTSNNTVT